MPHKAWCHISGTIFPLNFKNSLFLPLHCQSPTFPISGTLIYHPITYLCKNSVPMHLILCLPITNLKSTHLNTYPASSNPLVTELRPHLITLWTAVLHVTRHRPELTGKRHTSSCFHL